MGGTAVFLHAFMLWTGTNVHLLDSEKYIVKNSLYFHLPVWACTMTGKKKLQFRIWNFGGETWRGVLYS